MTTFAQVQINDQSFRQAESFMSQLPLEVRGKVVAPAVKAAGIPVAKRAEQLAPSSARTGSYKKWSKKTLRSRLGVAQHKDTMGVSSVRKYKGGEVVAVYVGPKWPSGNLINVIGHPHKQVLWGHVTGRTIEAVDYLAKAAEQTAGEQQSAFVSKVESETAKLLAKGVKP